MIEIMLLDADQSAKFWPIYKAFEKELTGIGDEILALLQSYVSNYDHMTGPVADRLLRYYVAHRAAVQAATPYAPLPGA